MKVKRILTLALAFCLCATLALATSCSGGSNSGKTSSKAGSGGTDNITKEEAFGVGVSEETIKALQDSGTITMYTMYTNIAEGDYDEAFQAEMDFYKKYYNLTIKWKFQAYGDDMSKFFNDYAGGDAPDLIPLNYRRWPKAGTRQVVYSVDELKEKGVVGLDHPEITRYEDVASRFRYRDKYYSPGIYYADPSFCAVNVDLFAKYSVKSPLEYYQEGSWDIDAYIKCCKELTRTTSEGKIWGGTWRDHTYYLVANDARLVKWNDDYTKLILTMDNKECIKPLETWASTYINGYCPSPEEGGGTLFKMGKMGMFIHDANNYAQGCKSYKFHWEIVPTPLGSNNTSGEIPGECSGNGIVTSSKNLQGALNYCIATSMFKMKYYNQPYGMFYVDTYKDVYNAEQIKMITDSAPHIGLDLYMGVGGLSSGQWNFWNQLKSGEKTTKEVFDTWKPVFQAEVDAENDAAAKALAANK